MNELPTVPATYGDCWNRIGVRGDRSCPELGGVGHCHNCPVFARAGRQFLNAAPPPGYLEEWTARLAAPPQEAAADLLSVLTFRLGEEWLGLPVQALVEVTPPRPVHRIPHRRGRLAGLVNIRGELHLCVYLDHVLGIHTADRRAAPHGDRLLVTAGGGQHWVFPVHEVDQVRRMARAELTATPPTVALAAGRLSAGVFRDGERSIGLLDAERLFQSLQGIIR
jgi:chemotaxis-related protein WspD